jgi:REP element-mobilizing transposase RayT
MGRGIEKKEIFFDSLDRNDFIVRLAGLAQDGALAVYAWALLPNHFHILCKTQQKPLSSSMRKLLTGYAVNFNRRHERHGHLFQNRYKSIVCQEDAYLLELVRYIHLNPLRAGLVKDMKELNRNPWSGHSALMGYVKRAWQDTDYVRSFFGRGHEGKRRYQAFVNGGIEQGKRPELVGGGLIRSAGGWFEVLALRRSGDRQISDQRILGDGEFVQQMLGEMDEMGSRNLRLPKERISLDSLAKRVCEVHGVRRGELLSGSRRHEIVEARQVMSRLSVKELGYSGAEVARYLGVTNSCVTRAAATGNVPDSEKYL